jgi:hypothetical protein
MCPAYVAGLIGAGDRKSVQPMAARDSEVAYDQLHHFIASSAWDTAPLETALLAEAGRMVGGENARGSAACLTLLGNANPGRFATFPFGSALI